MNTGELMLTVPTLVVCFIAFVWLLLSERRQQKRSGDRAVREKPFPASKPLDDYFSKTIHSRVRSGREREDS